MHHCLKHIALQSAIDRLLNISQLLHNTLLAIILSDIEQLLTRYMNKMRKHFSKMHWDDGAEGQFEI